MDRIDNGWEEGETRLDRVLETVVERARSLVDAKTVMVLLEDRGLLVVAATTGEFRSSAGASAFRPTARLGARYGGRQAERMAPLGGRLGMSLDELGIVAKAALLVPLSYRGRRSGSLPRSTTSATHTSSAPRTNRFSWASPPARPWP